MERKFPLPTGELNVSTAMPNKGTGTGFNGDTYGADTSQSAINRKVGIRGSTRSDPPFETDSNDVEDGDE